LNYANRHTCFGLRELLAPVGWETFLADYWEKRLCYIGGRDPEYYSDVFSLGDVDAVLPSAERSGVPTARMVDSNKRSTEDSAGFYGKFLGGSTVNINFVDRRFLPLHSLCRRMEEAFHFEVWANLYLTPPKSQGFAAHFDRHDVFVLQIAGEKRWEVWPPGYFLPLKDSRAPQPKGMQGTPESLLLKPGDLLYLPRGFVHQAYAEEQATLHITLGVEPVRRIDLAIAALWLQAERTPALREALPPGWIGRSIGHPQAGPLDETDITGSLLEASRDLIARLQPCLDNRFEVLAALESLDQSSVLRKREGMVSVLEAGEEKAHLYFRGGAFFGPVRILPALKFMVDNAAFRIADLPELSPASRLVLAKRLIKEGYLTVVP